MTKDQRLDEKVELYVSPEVVENMTLYRLGIVGNSSLELVRLQEELDYPKHFHEGSEAHFYMVSGEGMILIGNQELRYKSGDTFYIGKGVEHGFKPDSQTLFLSVQTPPIRNKQTGVEDIHFNTKLS